MIPPLKDETDCDKLIGIGRHSIEIPGTKSKTQESIGKLIVKRDLFWQK